MSQCRRIPDGILEDRKGEHTGRRKKSPAPRLPAQEDFNVKDRKRSTKPRLFRASFRWLNPGDGDSTATTLRWPRRTGPLAIHASPGAARGTARDRWREPFR